MYGMTITLPDDPKPFYARPKTITQAQQWVENILRIWPEASVQWGVI